jgi:hypothetical protein
MPAARAMIRRVVIVCSRRDRRSRNPAHDSDRRPAADVGESLGFCTVPGRPHRAVQPPHRPVSAELTAGCRCYTRRSLMPDLRVIWEDNALKLLEERDRYTRNTIREEFRRNPEKGAIEFDPGGRNFLTPVSDGRYSVIWRLDDQRCEAVVRAVVPLTNIPLDVAAMQNDGARTRLKEFVQRAVNIESKGAIDVP